jgi:hypothetical protein
MDKQVNDKSHLRCNLCNKYYSSKSSLCNHNKKFHNTYAHKTPNNTEKSYINTQKKLNNCKYCNNNFSRKYCVNRHEKIALIDMKKFVN